jgi:hypothetical protein
METENSWKPNFRESRSRTKGAQESSKATPHSAFLFFGLLGAFYAV